MLATILHTSVRLYQNTEDVLGVNVLSIVKATYIVVTVSTLFQLIGTLRLNTKMNVPKDYETRFEKAEQTFLYQIVFDPNTNKLVPLNPLPDDIDPAYLHFAGQYPFLLHDNFLLFQIRTVSWPAWICRVSCVPWTQSRNPENEKHREWGNTFYSPPPPPWQATKIKGPLTSLKTDKMSMQYLKFAVIP